MLTLYRAMCKEEADDMLKYRQLSFNSRFKWFGTYEFVTSRVRDGKFNNSKFKSERYEKLFRITFTEESLAYFSKCGYNEYMLDVRKVPFVKIISIEEV